MNDNLINMHYKLFGYHETIRHQCCHVIFNIENLILNSNMHKLLSKLTFSKASLKHMCICGCDQVNRPEYKMHETGLRFAGLLGIRSDTNSNCSLFNAIE